MTKRKFWEEVEDESEACEGDNILLYMKLMLDKAHAAQVPVRKSDFESYGKSLSFFEGVLAYSDDEGPHPGWFDRINVYGRESGVSVSHFIISSGIREMVRGSPLAKHFDKIYASSFCYDCNDVAVWPALALNYTSKTQYLFRVNKGFLDVHDHDGINKYVPRKDRPMPFERIVFIGDGITDIPCFRLVKDQGGHSLVVYKPNTSGALKKSEMLLKEGRVNFIAPADYREGKRLDRIVKMIVDKIDVDHQLYKS
jgi:hypothetical protein